MMAEIQPPLVERYERLRSDVLAQVPSSDRDGRALLLRRGLWSWARFASPEDLCPAGRVRVVRETGSVDPGLELARLLAGMALANVSSHPGVR